MTDFAIIHSFINITDSDNGMAANINITKGKSSANSHHIPNWEPKNADMTSDDMGWDKYGTDNRGGDDITSTRYIVNNNAVFCRSVTNCTYLLP